MGQSFRWRTGAGWRRSPCGCRPRLRPRGSARSSARPLRRHWCACRGCVQGMFRVCINQSFERSSCDCIKYLLIDKLPISHEQPSMLSQQLCSALSPVCGSPAADTKSPVVLCASCEEGCCVCKLRSRCQTSGKSARRAFCESQLYLRHLLLTLQVRGMRLLPVFTPGRAMMWGTILALWGTGAVFASSSRALNIRTACPV